MRVLGYGFESEAEASEAERTLVETYGLGTSDAQLADLAGNGVVLAVRAREENLDAVRSVLEQHGGERLVDVDERWTGLTSS